jgi:hypothetical protein
MAEKPQFGKKYYKQLPNLSDPAWNLTKFAGRSGSVGGNWRFSEQYGLKSEIWIFFFNETVQQTVSIFLVSPTKD